MTHNFNLVASKDGLEGILYEGKPVALPDCGNMIDGG